MRHGFSWRGGGRRSGCAILGLVMALAGCSPAGSAASARDVAAARARRTRGDLLAERSQVARLEADYALASARRAYVVLDIGERRLSYRLAGMILREVPLEEVSVRGLRRASEDAAPAPPEMAGIFSLREKEGDPRLSPLTPEQIEAGLDDENAVDAVPPDPPAEFSLVFKQPLRVKVLGAPPGASLASAWARLREATHAALASLVDGGGGPALRVTLRVDRDTAREIYRSLVPEERLLVVPPSGLLLPMAGQEPLPRPRPPKEVPRPSPSQVPGVPFQIPPPVQVEPKPEAGTPPPEAVPVPATGEAPAPPPGAAPEEPPPSPPEGTPQEPQGQEPQAPEEHADGAAGGGR